MGRRLILGVIVSGVLAVASTLLPAPAAFAQQRQDAVVSEDPADYTPNLVSDSVVAKPRALALGVSPDTVYVGGQFNQVSNAKRTVFDVRSHLFAFNRTTGALSSWSPRVDRPVWSILVAGDSVYIGGDFRTVNGQARPILAKLDRTTGALDTSFVPPINTGRVTEIRLVNGRLLVSGSFGPKLIALDPTTGRNTRYLNSISIAGSVDSKPGIIAKFAVNPQGTRLVAVGSFLTVNGQRSARVMMLDLNATNAAPNAWHYEPLEKRCASTQVLDYVTDVDFSPDGSYFAVVSTGFVPPSGTTGYICDAVARFETDVPAPSQPTWINYTGGDTLRSVAITGSAVYVQGHSRWLNNPQGRDSAGPGAVEARGGGAVDPATGLALSWAPDHACADGGRDILVTDDGIWWANDSKYWANEPRIGIQFTPLP